jgi:hypothetical protein
MYIVHEIASEYNSTLMLGDATVWSSLETKDPLGWDNLASGFVTRDFDPTTV